MLKKNVKYRTIVDEVVRLKELQKKLKEDISKYKKITTSPLELVTQRFTKDEKEKLLNNFHYRLQKNSWIMKKIIYDIKRNFN